MTDPAAGIDQPRSTSIEGPKLKIMAKPILNSPQINPAVTTAVAARRLELASGRHRSDGCDVRQGLIGQRKSDESAAAITAATG